MLDETTSDLIMAEDAEPAVVTDLYVIHFVVM